MCEECVGFFYFVCIKVKMFQWNFLEKTILCWTAFSPLSKITSIYLCESIYEVSILFHLSVCLSFQQCHMILNIIVWFVSCDIVRMTPTHLYFYFKIIFVTLSLPIHRHDISFLYIWVFSGFFNQYFEVSSYISCIYFC